MDLKPILERFSYLKTERSKWETHWKDVTSVINQRRGWWDENDSSGKTPDTKIYDSTAINALETFAHGLQGYAVSQTAKFFKLKMVVEKLNRLPYVQDWLEEVETQLYSSLNMSNFYTAFEEFVKDAGSTGTAFMFVKDDLKTERIMFSCRHPKECFIAENADGEVDTLFRSFRVPVRTMVQQFGLEALDQSWRTIYQDKPDQMVPVLHAVFPRGKEGPGRTQKKFASLYIDPQAEHLVDEGGYDSFPYLVWRYTKNSDEVYGRGIASNCLPEILRVNQMAKTLLQAAELQVNPPLNIPSSMKGRERLVPRGYNYYDQLTGKIEPIMLGTQLPFAWQELVQQQQSLKEKFFVNFFLMLESLEARGQMTATEVMERQSEKAAVLGAMVNRLNTECLSPLIDRIFSILQRDGLIPPPPADLLREGGEIEIEYMGPLAQAQRRFNKNSGIQALLGFIQALTQVEAQAVQGGSTTIDSFDLDELAYQGAQAAGSPQTVLREKPDIERIRMAKAQAMAAQQQQAVALEQQKVLAGNAEKLNQPMQPGSMLEQVVQR